MRNLISCFILLAAFFNANQETKASEIQADSTGYIVKVGDVAPDFTVKLTTGESVTLSQLRGKTVMLQFTASWCSVCRKEMPYIESDIWQRHKENTDFVLLGIDRDEPLDKVKAFAKSTKITYPLALDPGGDVFAKYALRDAGITRNVLIGPDGTILKTTRLYNPIEFNSLVNKIDEVLGTSQVERFTTKTGKELSIKLIKHGSLQLDYDNTILYVDPVPNFGNMHVDYSTYPKADFILITHEHGDHLNIETINNLSKENTLVLLNEKSRQQFGKGETVRNFETRSLNPSISLEVVPAYNITPDHLKFHPKGNGNGYILTIDGLRIYIAGDTENIEEMANFANIDVAFLPVNQPYTMTPEQAIKATELFNPKILYPYHYGQTDVTPIKEYFDRKETGVEVRIRNLQ